MMTPTLHLNGTAPQDLIDNLCNALVALRDAARALGQCAPNGRDYYPQGPDAIGKATQEHHARLNAVVSVIGDLTRLAETISAANDAREAIRARRHA